MITDSQRTALSAFDRAAYFDWVLRGSGPGDTLRIARMYRAQAELLEMVNASQPLSTVLNAVIDRVEYLISGSAASVDLMSGDERVTGVGASGLPLHRTATSSVPSTSAAAESTNLRACWSVSATDPANGKLLATLAVYIARPRSPDPIDMHVLDDMARVLGIGILARETEDLSLALAEESQRTANRLARLLEATEEGIYGMDADLRCTFINRAALEMLGIAQAETVLGRDMHDLIHHSLPDGTAYPRSECPIDETIRTGEPLVAHDELMHRSDGSTFTVALSAAPTLNAVTGEAVGAIVIFTDVTERIQHQRQLEEALRSKDEFVSSVAHELRTPLTAVVGFADVLSEGWEQMDSDEFTDLLGHISREAAEVGFLVEDLLVAARASMGRLTVRLEPVDLPQEARRVLYGWRQGALQHVKMRVDGEGLVSADPARVRQILRILLANALKFGRDTVDVVVGQEGTCRIVDVIDDGPGVPLRPDHLESIFEPYARAHDTPGLTASLGLGLSISRRLARAMGGNLTYLRVDDRTHFRLSLPVL